MQTPGAETGVPLIVHVVSLGANPLPWTATLSVPTGPELGVNVMVGVVSVTVNVAVSGIPYRVTLDGNRVCTGSNVANGEGSERSYHTSTPTTAQGAGRVTTPPVPEIEHDVSVNPESCTSKSWCRSCWSRVRS